MGAKATQDDGGCAAEQQQQQQQLPYLGAARRRKKRYVVLLLHPMRMGGPLVRKLNFVLMNTAVTLLNTTAAAEYLQQYIETRLSLQQAGMRRPISNLCRTPVSYLSPIPRPLHICA